MAETLRAKYEATASAFILGSIIYLYGFEFPIGGNATVSVSLVFLFLSFFFLKFSRQQFYYFLYFMTTMAAIFIVQRLVQPLPFDIPRTMLGLVLLIFGSLATIALWKKSKEDEHKSFLSCIIMFTYLHFSVQIGQAIFGDFFGISRQASYISFISRASGLALEASHVGMMLAPLVFISIVYPDFFTRTFGRSLHFVLAISILLVGISSTGVIIYGMALICRFIVRRSLVPLFWGGPIIVATVLFIEPIKERIVGVLMASAADPTQDNNLSVLVLIKGVEMAWGALMHHPFGAGMLNFQALEIYSSVAGFSSILEKLNSADGSSVLLKGVGEFGYVFVLFFIYIVCNFLSKLWSGPRSVDDVLRLALSFSIICSSVRGGGYFTSSVLIGFSLILFDIFKPKSISFSEVRGAML